jgi:hypothetical protein
MTISTVYAKKRHNSRRKAVYGQLVIATARTIRTTTALFMALLGNKRPGFFI